MESMYLKHMNCILQVYILKRQEVKIVGYEESRIWGRVGGLMAKRKHVGKAFK
jgi:hypothetical protein